MSSPVVFSLTGAQRDCLAAVAICRATWPTFRRSIRAALMRAELLSAVDTPELTEGGRLLAPFAVWLAHMASLAQERASAALAAFDQGHAETASVGLAHVSAKASPMPVAETR